MFLEVESLLNYRVERTVILNETTKEKNKVLGDDTNETVKLHRPERSREEALLKIKSVVEVEQKNDGPQKNDPWQKIKPHKQVKPGIGNI